ncbi:hypothetical protein [Rhizobium sp. P007]|jgi:hypothetical protein|uniref:hypothetical protein n=1 Tax=Rhizobium sp. P007 TaxID=285908 RepID=UPI00115968EF|nr:hypothetical protein [Rhizobium sp. P007]CAD7045666.1 hypothetical protein RP007_04909 [Rhizobium sp. P007]
MKHFFESLGMTVLLFVFAPLAVGAQTKQQIEQRDPDFCGAGGAGCDPADVQQWKAIGNRLADLSSADLSQYAYACAEHHEWKEECETDPIAILKRLGIEGY